MCSVGGGAEHKAGQRRNLHDRFLETPGAAIAWRSLCCDKKMPLVSHSDTASLTRPSADVAQDAVQTRYRFWVRDSTVSCWRQLPEAHTMAEMARMLRQKPFAEFALIDGSAHPA